MKILIVEDNENIANLIHMQLSMHEFETVVVHTGKKCLEQINQTVDLVILDMMLPDCKGFELIEAIKRKNIPIIILTALEQIEDKVKGFQLGADDYLTKPFECIELIMRVKALLKRNRLDQVIVVEDITIDFASRSIRRSNKLVDLTAREFDLLTCLVRNRGLALSRDQLIEQVWGYDYLGESRTVDMHVQRLRKKLGISITTIYKYGYRLEAV